MAGSKARARQRSASSPVYEQKAAQEPVRQVAGSSGTTGVAIFCDFIICAVILPPSFWSRVITGDDQLLSVSDKFPFSFSGCVGNWEAGLVQHPNLSFE